MQAVPSTLIAAALRTGLALSLLLLVLSPMVALADESGNGEVEALEAEAADESADDYYTELALMLGRLRAGYELYRIGDREDGGRHFILLSEQHLPVMRDALAGRDLDLLIRRIEQLAERAESSNSWIEVQDLHEASRMSLQHAATRVDPATREDAGFKVEIVLALAREAVRHYEESLDDGEFVNPEAYQTSFGFINHGRSLIERNAGLLGQAGDDVQASLVERYETVMEAWPSIRLPDEPRVNVEELREHLAALESVAERY